jgi:hypothetical protein
MILRGVVPEERAGPEDRGDSPKSEPSQTSRGSAAPRPIWKLIEASQKQMVGAQECWLITQPAHSALSGEIAAKLSPSAFGALDASTIRAIALHDAGWSNFDSELIRASRSVTSHPVFPKKGKIRVGRQPEQLEMVPFLAVSPEESVNAWTGSIETALKVSALGGYLVSEHFRTIALMLAKAKPETAKQMGRFIAQEDTRQSKIRPMVTLVDAEIARQIDGLRFCDLLSLYLCIGILESAQFSQQIQGDKLVIRPVSKDTFSLTPSPFSQEEMFSFAALRHPRTKSVSSATFLCKIVG